jgi:hypothetical protein
MANGRKGKGCEGEKAMRDGIRETRRAEKRLHLLEAWPRDWRSRGLRRVSGRAARIVILDFQHLMARGRMKDGYRMTDGEREKDEGKGAETAIENKGVPFFPIE